MLFGNKIRELRDEQGVLQRQLAAALEIDTPMFSKIERGDRYWCTGNLCSTSGVYGLTATPIRKDGHQPIIFMQRGKIRYTANAKSKMDRQNLFAL